MREYVLMIVFVSTINVFAAVPQVDVRRVPGGGIQPQAVTGTDGTIHLLYFRGAPQAGDLFYVRMLADTDKWSKPLRVNSQPGSAVAVGSMRGGRIALGEGGAVHVAWNGSGKAEPRTKHPPGRKHGGAPMLYSRLTDGAFQPQRNLMTKTFALDGGGSVAADDSGNVYVTWHATTTGAPDGEAGRTVWAAKSSDGGKTFASEIDVVENKQGACGCCGLHAMATGKVLSILYRTAGEQVNRDMVLLTSTDGGSTFGARVADRWRVNRCVISTPAFTADGAKLLGAWETMGQVVWQDLSSSKSRIHVTPGKAKDRKYPSLARSTDGFTLVTWSQGAGWNKAGAASWQLYNPAGRPITESHGSRRDSPVWNFPAAAARTDGSFLVVY